MVKGVGLRLFVGYFMSATLFGNFSCTQKGKDIQEKGGLPESKAINLTIIDSIQIISPKAYINLYR
jgi:hypothetical protein